MALNTKSIPGQRRKPLGNEISLNDEIYYRKLHFYFSGYKWI